MADYRCDSSCGDGSLIRRHPACDDDGGRSLAHVERHRRQRPTDTGRPQHVGRADVARARGAEIDTAQSARQQQRKRNRAD